MYKPNESFDHVLVYVKKAIGDGYKWTSGHFTSKTGKHDEHFEIVTDSPLVEGEKGMYHYEDIKNATDENIDRYIR